MAKALVSAVEIEAVDQLGDHAQPRHVLLQVVSLLGDIEQGTLRLRLVLVLDLIQPLVLGGVCVVHVSVVGGVGG